MDDTLYASSLIEWRAWLQANHARASQVWLVYFKGSAHKPAISYEDSVDEALCYGWIDSRIKRIDDQSYARLFTPRQPKSHWSESNKRRVRMLIQEGRMTPAGLALVNFPLDENLDSAMA